MYQSQNKIDQAKTWYEKALASRWQGAGGREQPGVVDGRNRREPRCGVAARADGEGGFADLPEVDDTLGWIYYKKGLNTQAIRALEASVQRQPMNASYHYHLGLAYINNKDTEKARKALEQALSLKLSPQDSDSGSRKP